MSFTGKGVKRFFENESGQHRWQRIPPTERKGRVHSSTVTVAVIEENNCKFILNRNDVERKFTRGSGNGGQNRNKVETVVVLTHIPTGLIIRCEEHRTQGKNEEMAWKRLEDKLNQINNDKLKEINKINIFRQIGYGGRNDKKRTYRIQDGFVLDHITEKRISTKELYKGNIKLLHPSNI